MELCRDYFPTRAYKIADSYRRRGVYVAMGGLHVTSLPDEAAQHADTILLGPGEEAFPAYLESTIASFYERAGIVYSAGFVDNIAFNNFIENYLE